MSSIHNVYRCIYMILSPVIVVRTVQCYLNLIIVFYVVRKPIVILSRKFNKMPTRRAVQCDCVII